MLGRKIMHERRTFDLPVWYGNINNDNNYIYPSGVATPFSIDFFGQMLKSSLETTISEKIGNTVNVTINRICI